MLRIHKMKLSLCINAHVDKAETCFHTLLTRSCSSVRELTFTARYHGDPGSLTHIDEIDEVAVWETDSLTVLRPHQHNHAPVKRQAPPLPALAPPTTGATLKGRLRDALTNELEHSVTAHCADHLGYHISLLKFRMTLLRDEKFSKTVLRFLSSLW